jgi:hypothetical protein
MQYAGAPLDAEFLDHDGSAAVTSLFPRSPDEVQSRGVSIIEPGALIGSMWGIGRLGSA